MNLTPIYLVSSGRSGSTLLMKILSLHPQILVRSIFPYETRASQYYYLSYQQGKKQSSFSLLEFKNAVYRPFPLKDKDSAKWSESQSSTELTELGHNLTESYYSFLSVLEKKEKVSYFAEKAKGIHLCKLMTENFPNSKVIFLYRDPRDIFISAKLFNKKRGNSRFGGDKGDHAMYSQIIRFLKTAKKFSKNLGDRAVTITYEYLIEDKKNAIKALFEGLDIELNEDKVEKIAQVAFEKTEESEKHKTTEEAKKSVERWRDEVDEETNEIFKKFSNEIEDLGYSSIY